MAQVNSKGRIVLTVNVEFDEAEARALLAITKYGEDRFKQMVCDSLGEQNFAPHAAAIDGLFRTLRNGLQKHVNAVDKAREVFKGITEGQ